MSIARLRQKLKWAFSEDTVRAMKPGSVIVDLAVSSVGAIVPLVSTPIS